MKWKFDYLIVGAGFSGLVMAERLATQRGKTCLVVDTRSHIGGNACDEYDSDGVLVHKYGPHYFRTNSPKIRDYLSRFTDWRMVNYNILSWADGKYWNFPINLNTYEQLIGRPSTEAEFTEFLAKTKVDIADPKNSEDVIVSQVGWELYEKFFKNYTLKQWNKHPKELDASVCGRIPIRTNRDDRYLREDFQALPAAGYHKMFEKMINASPLIKVLLKTNYREVARAIEYNHLIYSGPIDEFYDHCFGALPYRSLRFEFENFGREKLEKRISISGKSGFWQPAMQVNFPNDHDYTRIVEIKHATGQLCENTTIVREYPENYGPGKEAYYPLPTAEAQRQYKLYEERANTEKNVSFVGRLATYRYYNMDQVVGMALVEYEKIKDQ
jgi:UDP-galactopyranose mutase